MGARKEAHGGALKDLYLSGDALESERAAALNAKSWDLNQRQLCDIELLLNGAFSPLEGFLNKADYDSVLSDMRLSSGVLWPMPINLEVSQDFGDSLSPGEKIALRDPEGVLIATLDVEDVWTPDKAAEAKAAFGTNDEAHPAVHYLMHKAGPVYVGGKLNGIEHPVHYDFKHLRHDPQDIRDLFDKYNWRKVVAFQTRNPMHRAHQELTLRAAHEHEANLLVHPIIGMGKPGDIDHYTRVRCYEKLLARYPEQTTLLSLMPLAMRMAGPREAVWHGIVRKNYGCTHFIVGRDHAGPGPMSNGEDPYGPYDAQELFEKHEDEIGVKLVPFKNVVYVEDRAEFVPDSEVKDGEKVMKLSGTELRRRLREGLDIPEWFSYPEVVAELRATHPPRESQGFTVFFTGLSGSGKSTIANALMAKLMEVGGRSVTLLDGDLVRKHLSSELGFSKEHRNLNILRIGYVASEITKNGGIAICAPIAPYTATRREVRGMIEGVGGFIEVHVATSLEECERRDRKGLYAMARAGKIKEFTGISDPYEEPENPELRIHTEDITPDMAAHQVLLKLKNEGFLK